MSLQHVSLEQLARLPAWRMLGHPDSFAVSRHTRTTCLDPHTPLIHIILFVLHPNCSHCCRCCHNCSPYCRQMPLQEIFGVALQIFDDLWKISDPEVDEGNEEARADNETLFSNCMVGTRILLNELLKLVSEGFTLVLFLLCCMTEVPTV